MLFSKVFVATLVAALTTVLAQTETTGDVSLAQKRAALEHRMHQRAHAGHGALKKRQLSEQEVASKERIARAQHKPTRTDIAAPGLEKRQLGFGVGNTGLGAGTGVNGLGCVCVLGVCSGLGCVNPSPPKTSQYPCQGRNYDGCNPGANFGVGTNGITYGSSVGVSQCCQTGYSCSKLGPFGQSFCLNFGGAQLYTLQQLIAANTFSTQTEFQNFLNGQKSITGY